MGLANSSWSLAEDKQLHSLVEKRIKSPYVIRNSLYSELLSPPSFRFSAPSWVLRVKGETVTLQKELWVSRGRPSPKQPDKSCLCCNTQHQSQSDFPDCEVTQTLAPQSTTNPCTLR